MELTPLNAISPVDGRYHKITQTLSNYFSEGALIRYRVLVEVEYFIALCNLPLPQLTDFDKGLFDSLRSIPADARRVKDIEAITNHDVKAVEYYLKEKFDGLNLEAFKEFIHFGSGRIQGVYPFWLNITGYQQYRDPMLFKGRLDRSFKACSGRGRRGLDGKGPAMERYSHAGAHPRSAGITNQFG